MNDGIRIFDAGRDLGPMEVYEDVDGEISLSGSSSSVHLGDERDALLVAKCIEVVAGFRDPSDLTEQEREKLQELTETTA